MLCSVVVICVLFIRLWVLLFSVRWLFRVGVVRLFCFIWVLLMKRVVLFRFR